ncbi:GH3 auxin-responsive promoter family protein, partial [Candidatus Aerophobetes bacterium]|nr:GH3 auxin-responsive promoter family protein [Candidatus Aerophobetes bacterium]
MANATELLRQGKKKEVWQKYCGFIDLSIDEVMKIQEKLLMEQIELLSKCELGRKFLGDKVPQSVEEFRKNVPLTTYEDYAPYLSEKREDVLPEKPYIWCHTSGKTGQHKWVPYTKRMYKALGKIFLTSLILVTSKKKGNFLLEEGDSILYCVAPPPYISGVGYRAMAEELNVTFMPPLEEAEKMDFAERMKEAFKISLIKGMDVFGGASSVLVNIGRRFSGEGEKSKMPISSLLHPLAAMRIIKALIKSKI